ncbi:MAG: hypothetical protein ABSD42_14465 [Candidatus Bathyarchaeia archaeon]|jgi:uncharacterized protein YjbJ (UPF0337 family)
MSKEETKGKIEKTKGKVQEGAGKAKRKIEHKVPEEKKKVEIATDKTAAERTGEAVGKGIRKSAKAVNDFGKGMKKGLKKEE